MKPGVVCVLKPSINEALWLLRIPQCGKYQEFKDRTFHVEMGGGRGAGRTQQGSEPDPLTCEGNSWLGTPVLLGAPSAPPSLMSLPRVDEGRPTSDLVPLVALAALWVPHSLRFGSLLSCQFSKAAEKITLTPYLVSLAVFNGGVCSGKLVCSMLE